MSRDEGSATLHADPRQRLWSGVSKRILPPRRKKNEARTKEGEQVCPRRFACAVVPGDQRVSRPHGTARDQSRLALETCVPREPECDAAGPTRQDERALVAPRLGSIRRMQHAEGERTHRESLARVKDMQGHAVTGRVTEKRARLARCGGGAGEREESGAQGRDHLLGTPRVITVEMAHDESAQRVDTLAPEPREHRARSLGVTIVRRVDEHFRTPRDDEKRLALPDFDDVQPLCGKGIPRCRDCEGPECEDQRADQAGSSRGGAACAQPDRRASHRRETPGRPERGCEASGARERLDETREGEKPCGALLGSPRRDARDRRGQDERDPAESEKRRQEGGCERVRGETPGAHTSDHEEHEWPGGKRRRQSQPKRRAQPRPRLLSGQHERRAGRKSQLKRERADVARTREDERDRRDRQGRGGGARAPHESPGSGDEGHDRRPPDRRGGRKHDEQGERSEDSRERAGRVAPSPARGEEDAASDEHEAHMQAGDHRDVCQPGRA